LTESAALKSRTSPAFHVALKRDGADAAAICEAVTRPSMRFVPIKSAEQQAALMSDDLLVRQRTQLFEVGS
jgi:transposase